MQHTFQVNSGNLNEEFIKTVQAVFGKEEIEVLVKENDKQSSVDQKEIYEKTLAIRERFKDLKVDPNLDLSSLANDVNL